MGSRRGVSSSELGGVVIEPLRSQRGGGGGGEAGRTGKENFDKGCCW